MGLDEHTQRLIRAVAENDIGLARKMAVEAIDADKTQKNRWFVNKYKAILTSEGANMIELSGNLRDIMLCEDVSYATTCFETDWEGYHIGQCGVSISGQGRA